MTANSSNDPLKSPIIQEIIMSNRIGFICDEIARRLDIPPTQALEQFYESQTCANLHDPATGLYLFSDLYIVDEYLIERGKP